MASQIFEKLWNIFSIYVEINWDWLNKHIGYQFDLIAWNLENSHAIWNESYWPVIHPDFSKAFGMIP